MVHQSYVQLNMCFLRVSIAISDPTDSLFSIAQSTQPPGYLNILVFKNFEDTERILQCVSETKTRLGQPEVKRLTNFEAHSELVDRP